MVKRAAEAALEGTIWESLPKWWNPWAEPGEVEVNQTKEQTMQEARTTGLIPESHISWSIYTKLQAGPPARNTAARHTCGGPVGQSQELVFYPVSKRELAIWHGQQKKVAHTVSCPQATSAGIKICDLYLLGWCWTYTRAASNGMRWSFYVFIDLLMNKSHGTHVCLYLCIMCMQTGSHTLYTPQYTHIMSLSPSLT